MFFLPLKVRVVAESDPQRMLSDTEAWRRRLLDVKEFEPQRPLYTYTDTQVMHYNTYPPITFSFCWNYYC